MKQITFPHKFANGIRIKFTPREDKNYYHFTLYTVEGVAKDFSVQKEKELTLEAALLRAAEYAGGYFE
jgi:hypothetical protein